MTVAPVLAAMLEAQNNSRLSRWLGKCYIYRQKKNLVRLSARGGLIFKEHCACSKISHLPGSGYVYC